MKIAEYNCTRKGKLSRDSLEREVRGLQAATKGVPKAQAHLLAHTIESGLQLPPGVTCTYVWQWLLSGGRLGAA